MKLPQSFQFWQVLISDWHSLDELALCMRYAMIEDQSAIWFHRGVVQESPDCTGWSMIVGSVGIIVVDDCCCTVVLLLSEDHTLDSVVESLFVVDGIVLVPVVFDEENGRDHHGIALSKRGVFCTTMIKIAIATITSIIILSTRRNIFILSKRVNHGIL